MKKLLITLGLMSCLALQASTPIIRFGSNTNDAFASTNAFRQNSNATILIQGINDFHGGLDTWDPALIPTSITNNLYAELTNQITQAGITMSNLFATLTQLQTQGTTTTNVFATQVALALAGTTMSNVFATITQLQAQGTTITNTFAAQAALTLAGTTMSNVFATITQLQAQGTTITNTFATQAALTLAGTTMSNVFATITQLSNATNTMDAAALTRGTVSTNRLPGFLGDWASTDPSTIGTGSGDVTAAGTNKFTGPNTFTGPVTISNSSPYMISGTNPATGAFFNVDTNGNITTSGLITGNGAGTSNATHVAAGSNVTTVTNADGSVTVSASSGSGAGYFSMPVLESAGQSVSSSQHYFIGLGGNKGISTTATQHAWKVPTAMHLQGYALSFYIGGTAGSGENCTLIITNLSAVTTVTGTTTLSLGTANQPIMTYAAGLNLGCASNDVVCIGLNSPSFATNATTVTVSGYVWGTIP